MIAKIRTGLSLLFFGTATLILPPLQLLALRTGLVNARIMPRLWHASIVKALGMRIHVNGAMATERPLMIAANHVSWTDIAVLGSLVDVSFIAKSEVARWPVMGSLSKLQRTHFVERERKRQSGKQASEIAKRLAGGDVMVLFAEGTTGDGNFILPFKSTLFGAAQMALGEGGLERVFIQPVTIAYTRLHGLPMGRRQRGLVSWVGDTELLPHLRWLLRQGAIDVEVHFGEPVEFADGSARKAVARQVEAQVRRMLTDALRNPRASR